MIVLYILLGLIGIIILLALIAPKKYEVNRSVIIDKSLPEVFQYLKFVRNQDHWSPWKKKDPNMKQESVGTDGEVGFIAKWEGNKQVGTGEQEILHIEHNEQIKTQLRFLKPWKSVSDAYIKVTEVDTNQTNVTWGFTGNNPVPMNIFMLFFNFEKAVGKDFEEGLASLKEILDKQ
ncbi:SRPBCC family protein [Xanthomarina spongicola]|uniref:Polyketide cyclase/dehydrase/lipid transport protein n=1 Tax=Xanthomarina spongicola TaxID=570520 RepID=A0A316DJW7_9FLAO|nr:SRPBCC family protein [Xanthomarina spongicola]PWK17956.1 polyketide cyclase/dehydrase/lipid transport protein [Xanthomarina spongicola]